MKSDELILHIVDLYLGPKTPLFIWGSPGIGKSASVSQAAGILRVKIREEHDAEFLLEDQRLSQMDPVDLRGFPKEQDDSMVFLAPSWLKRLCEPGVYGILFLDELNAAPPAVQAAAYQLVLDRRIGDYVLSENVLIIAAGNRETDRAVTSRLSSALANRFGHVDFDVDVDAWVNWALRAGIKIEIPSFIRFRGDLLNTFDPRENSKSFGSPRSWEFTARYLECDPPQSRAHEVVKGYVGEGPATELFGFLKICYSLPDIDAAILNPDTFEGSTDPATCYAISGALSRKATKDNFGRVIKVAEKLGTEFGVLTVRDAITRDGSLTKTEYFIRWASDNTDVLT